MRLVLIFILVILLALTGCMSVSPYADIQFISTHNSRLLLAVYGEENSYDRIVVDSTKALGAVAGTEVDVLYYDEAEKGEIYAWADEHPERSCIVLLGRKDIAAEVKEYAADRDIDVGYINISSETGDISEELNFDITLNSSSFGVQAAKKLVRYLGDAPGRIILVGGDNAVDIAWTRAFYDRFSALRGSQDTELIDSADIAKLLDGSAAEGERIAAVVCYDEALCGELLSMTQGSLSEAYIVGLISEYSDDLPQRPCILYVSFFDSLGEDVIRSCNEASDMSRGSMYMEYSTPDHTVKAEADGNQK